jgi:UDP:flavonoid glycosyltransferase YjiC (YdhE family)
LATHAHGGRTVLEPVEFQHVVEPDPISIQAGPAGAAATVGVAVVVGGAGRASDVLAATSRLDLLTMAESLAVVARDVERRVPTPFHSQHIAHRGPCGKTRVVPQNLRPKPEPAEIRDSRSTCALVDVWVSRDVEPPVGLAVRLRALGAEVRVCAPPDCAEQLAEMQPC